MKAIVAIGLLFAVPAFADDYVQVSAGGSVASYQGTIVHMDMQGLGGTLILDARWPPTVSTSDTDGPTETGSWHVIVHQPDSKSSEQMLQCSAHVMYAEQCSTIKLTCVQPATSVVKQR